MWTFASGHLIVAAFHREGHEPKARSIQATGASERKPDDADGHGENGMAGNQGGSGPGTHAEVGARAAKRSGCADLLSPAVPLSRPNSTRRCAGASTCARNENGEKHGASADFRAGAGHRTKPDPAANIRDRLVQNRPGFNFEPGPPDEDSLI